MCKNNPLISDSSELGVEKETWHNCVEGDHRGRQSGFEKR